MKLVRSASAKLRLSHATSRTAAKPTLPVTATTVDVRKLMARLEVAGDDGDGNCKSLEAQISWSLGGRRSLGAVLEVTDLLVFVIPIVEL
nr:hypothetical protein Itr_chr03CG10770 [Ipomoea trifida]